ncbi:MAG: DUF4337 domain-containing protein [Magnetococcales bacterium]|nr:DUF4337 domain-containing protein [Magnetococcales bacterium]
MSDLSDTVNERIGGEADTFNNVVAILVTVLATLMALFNVKDGNIVQSMAMVQAQSIDTWGHYQAKSVKENMVEGMLDQLRVQRSLLTLPNALLEEKILFNQTEVKRYRQEKEELKAKAEGLDREYNRLNLHDDQFDLAEAGISVAIAILGIAALTRKRALVGLALILGGFGVFMGVAGFLAWPIHPDLLASLFS